MTEQQFLQLIDKYLSGETTAEENRALLNTYQSFQQKAEWNSEELGSAENLQEDILLRIKESIGKSKESRIVPFYKKKRAAWLAAASIILILIAGTVFFTYFNREASHKEVIVNTPAIQNDIAPGGNKATLTLADGSTIVLDSAQNGAISQQGNIKVVKEGEGKLAYQLSAISHEQSAIQYNTVTTPRGGQYQLILADGTKVWLNAASSIRFPTAFPGKERTVVITGEAYFEVAHDAEKPFHVKVNSMDVAVLGTHFNINAYPDEEMVKTTLLKGSVKVSDGKKSIMITPGEQALLTNSSGALSIKKDVDLEEIVAWKNGEFIFQNADIHSIMRQLARWYDISVSYNGNVTKEQFVGMVSRDVNISQILNMLGSTKTVKFEIVGKKIIVK